MSCPSGSPKAITKIGAKGFNIGKSKHYYPDINPGDKGKVTPMGRINREIQPGKTHNFYPAKWGYLYCFGVGPEEFELAP